MKRKRLKLDPDLADGQFSLIHDSPDWVLLDMIREWMRENEPGSKFTIELVELSDSDVSSLPEI